MLTCTEFCHEADTVTDSVNILCSLGLTPRSRCCCGRTRARVMNRRTFICGRRWPNWCWTRFRPACASGGVG